MEDERHTEAQQKKKGDLIAERRSQQKDLERRAVCILLALPSWFYFLRVHWLILLDEYETQEFATDGKLSADKDTACFGRFCCI
jgi:hypothetical protein